MESQILLEIKNTFTALRKAFNHWFDEYHHRVSTDEKFAAQVLLRKLERFPLGELGFCPPVEFDETELALLERSFHTDAEFQNMLEQETDCVRDILEYLLEERNRQVPKDKSL